MPHDARNGDQRRRGPAVLLGRFRSIWLAGFGLVLLYVLLCLSPVPRMLLKQYPQVAPYLYPPFGQARESYTEGEVGPFRVGQPPSPEHIKRWGLRQEACPPRVREWFSGSGGIACYTYSAVASRDSFWFVETGGHSVVRVTIVTQVPFEI